MAGHKVHTTGIAITAHAVQAIDRKFQKLNRTNKKPQKKDKFKSQQNSIVFILPATEFLGVESFLGAETLAFVN
jgi:ERCC4-type nuclease